MFINVSLNLRKKARYSKPGYNSHKAVINTKTKSDLKQ